MGVVGDLLDCVRGGGWGSRGKGLSVYEAQAPHVSIFVSWHENFIFLLQELKFGAIAYLPTPDFVPIFWRRTSGQASEVL